MAEISEQIQAAVLNTLESYGQFIVAEVKERLLTAKKLASGDAYNSLRFEVEEEGHVVTLEILANEYFKYIEQGRAPGSKMPPLFNIVKWLESRRLDVFGTPYANRAKGVYKGRKRKAALIAKGNSPKQRVRVAWLIARSIAKKGIKPFPVMKETIAKIAPQLNDSLTFRISKVVGDAVAEQWVKSFAAQGIKVETVY